ncbi:MAG: tetratricopeptide (TPR) repeat protein [Cryomorphaceae bacterium]|jgi:tetratricopeptide (TPR) repeat protein
MRIISVTTALALSLSGSLSAQNPAKPKLTDDPIYIDGISAMTDHLPGIASKKFASLLASQAETIDAKDKLQLLFLLAESQIRATQPSQALTTLTDPLIADHPDAFFWKGQALATAGRYNDAIQMLEQAAPESKHYKLAQIKIAYLAAALNDIDKAIAILSKSLADNEDTPSLSPQSYLSLANLHIAKKDPVNAAKILEKIFATDEPTIKVKQVIQAQVKILQKNYPQAITMLGDLVKSPETLDHKTLSYATLYLADALQLNNQNQEAIDTLVRYLDENADSPLLGPMFTRLGNWIPEDASITDITIKKIITWADRGQQETASGITLSNRDEERADLRAFAHYYYARCLATQTETTSKTKAIFEFSLLRLRHPTHILAGTSLSDTATTQLALDRMEPAKETLKLIQRLNIPIAPIAKQQAAFLLGKLNLDEKNYPASAAAFQTVVDTAQNGTQLQTAAIINAASAYLSAADAEGFQKLKQNIGDIAIQNNLLLEYALWLANENRPEARSILYDFTLKFPDHPRITEARMALAHHCLRVSPVDADLCQTIIPEISKEKLHKDQYADYSYLLYRNAAANMDYAGAANAARQFIETFPQHPRMVEFTLLQGQAFYHNGQHNEARIILKNLVATYPEHPLKNYAKYYAAMTAKQVNTPQSKDEAILLFSEIAGGKSNLSTESLLQLSKLYMDKNQPQQAVNALKLVFDAQPKGKKSLNIGNKLASAYHAQGGSEPANFQLALNIYDTLIKQHQGDPQSLNQIKYNQALTLQHMGNDDKALEIYYSVINIDTKIRPITEWIWYYRCGFDAIAMLEEMKNPNGAIAIAKKLAASNGSRAEDARVRARKLEMKHMIWEF